MRQTNPVEIGVIGAGHLGRYHIECLQRIEGFSLVGFYDSNPERANELSSKYGIPSFDNIALLMDRVKALCIVTPTITHFDIAVSAIEAGKHLFIEKPLTDHPDTCRKLADLISSHKLIGRVGHVERYNPAFIAAQEMGIDKPVFIEAHRLAPFNPREWMCLW